MRRSSPVRNELSSTATAAPPPPPQQQVSSSASPPPPLTFPSRSSHWQKRIDQDHFQYQVDTTQQQQQQQWQHDDSMRTRTTRTNTKRLFSNASTATTTTTTTTTNNNTPNASSISSMSYYSNSTSQYPSSSNNASTTYKNHSNRRNNNKTTTSFSPPSRSPSRSSPPPPPPFASRASVENFLRKSAIQDVIQAFQCKEPTHVSSSSSSSERKVFSKKRTTTFKNKSDGYIRNHPRGDVGCSKQEVILDNSLLEEEDKEEEGVGLRGGKGKDADTCAFHPFSSLSSETDSFSYLYPQKKMNRDDSWNNGWFAKPVLDACRGRFQQDDEEKEEKNEVNEGKVEKEQRMGLAAWSPTSPMMSCLDSSRSSSNKRETDVYYYRGEDDDAFLNLKKGSWSEKDLNQVFRTRVNEVVEEMNGGGGGGGGDTDKFQQESAWDDSVQDWVFHNKVALKQGKGSSTRLLDPSPRDSDPWRQSPSRRRERMEKNQSQKLEMKLQVQGEGRGGYSERNALDFMENDMYGKNESWGKDKKHNQQDQEYHNHTISSSIGSKEGRRREKLQSNNNNLLDESLSQEESSPRSAKKKNINVSTPGTEQTLESTPAAESNPSTSPLSSVLYGDGIKKEKQGLADVRMKLFQQQSAPLKLTQDTKVENGEERIQHGYKPSMSDAKSSPLSDTGPPTAEHASNANQNESNEKRIEKQSQVTLMEENEFLRRQLVRYKKLLLENGKISKNEPCRSETSSTISSESGSSKTASTMFSQSEAIQIKAQMVNLKASLSKKEAEFDKLKEAYEQIDLSQKAQIQQLREKLKNYKSKAEYGVLEAQMSAMQKSVDLYKEQLEESEEYIKELEKTIDHQLQMWQEEEEAFRKEVDALREQSNGSAHYKEHCGTTKAEVEKLKEELQHAKKEIEELRSTKDTLDNSLRSTNMKRLAKESTERHEETVRILQEEKDELERELRELKTNMENLRDQSMSVEFENKTEIKKLKEQLNHAAFRVQVMRNESPKRKRQDGSNTDSEESTVSRLMEQLKEADRKTEEAWASKKKVEESLVALKAMEEENAEKHCAEMDTLSKKLSEARSRSRRIAVKSEEELAKIRESEREFKRKANIYQEQATELRQCIAKLQHQYSDELSSRKRIESALRNEISLLRQDKVSKSSNSILPYSVNLNSNRVGNELKFLIDMCSTLQSSVEPISKAKQKIGKDMLDRVVNNVDELAAVVRKIEVAAEEDKLQIENAFSIYDSAVTSYEKQIESLQENIKMSKEELATCTQQRLESAKKAKQAEIDLQAKLNSLKVQLAKVQQEYHQYREKMELKSDPNVATDFSSKDDPNDTKVLSVGEVQTSVNEAVQHQSETAKASNRKMNVLTGISKGGIELNLREAEESMALSTTSNNNSDLISRWRSMDFSTNTDLCDTDKQEPGERSIHTSQSSPDDVLTISKSDASGLQTNDSCPENDFCPEDEKCQTTTEVASQYSDQASKSSQSISHEKNESSWQSGSTISDFSKLNDLSRDGAKEINGAQNDSSSTAQFREELADSTQDDGDTSVGSQSDDDNRCYDDTTQASV